MEMESSASGWEMGMTVVHAHGWGDGELDNCPIFWGSMRLAVPLLSLLAICGGTHPTPTGGLFARERQPNYPFTWFIGMRPGGHAMHTVLANNSSIAAT